MNSATKIFTIKKIKIAFGVLLCLLVLATSALFLVGCDFFGETHNYNILFSGQDLGSARIGDEFNAQIHTADFTASRDNQRIFYRLDGVALPRGLELNPHTGQISGRILPDATRPITLGVTTFRIAAEVFGSYVYVSQEFSINIGGGEFGVPDYDFSLNFVEEFNSGDYLTVRVDASIEDLTSAELATHFARTPLQIRTNEYDEWQNFPPFSTAFGYGTALSVLRGAESDIQIRYAPIYNQMVSPLSLDLNIDTRPTSHASDFFIFEGGVLTGFSDFFIAYFSGNAITLPATTTSVHWQALSGFMFDTIATNPTPSMPRFNSITVPASITSVVGQLNSNGIHYRQVIIFEGTTPPSFSNPLPPAPIGTRFMRGGRFIVPDNSLLNYREQMADFGQRITNIPATHLNVFGANRASDGFLIYELLDAGARRYALISYFSNSDLVIVPTRVGEIKAGAFNGANHIEQLVLPSGLTYVRKNAFVICDTLFNLQTIYFEGVRSVWDSRANFREEGFPTATVLFFSQTATEAGTQWNWVGEGANRTPLAW